MAAPGFDVEVNADQTLLTLTYRMPKQILMTMLREDWERGVMDEAVEQADKRGLMCVGPVMVSEPEDIEPDAGEVQVSLPEGIRIDASQVEGFDEKAFLEGFGRVDAVSVNMFQVVATVNLMGSMG